MKKKLYEAGIGLGDVNLVFVWRGEREGREGGSSFANYLLSFCSKALALLLIQTPRPSWKTLEFGRSRRRRLWKLWKAHQVAAECLLTYHWIDC